MRSGKETSNPSRVERPPDFGGLLTTLAIEIFDGIRVARIKRGSSVKTGFAPGPHIFRIRHTWFGSEPLSPQIAAETHITLSASTEERATRFTEAFLRPWSALELKLILTE